MKNKIIFISNINKNQIINIRFKNISLTILVKLISFVMNKIYDDIND